MTVPRTGTFDFPRAVRASDAASLRALGLTYRQIADRMGISRSYASELVTDPVGLKIAARKASYQGVCEDCGGPTTGSDGPRLAPKVCASCLNKRRESQHGTRSRYNGRGCRCDLCTEANRLYMKSLKGRPAPFHGLSGYINYACRCDVCRKAGSRENWLRYDQQERSRRLKRQRAAA